MIFITSFLIYSANIKFDYDRDLKHHITRRLLPADDLIPNTFLPYMILKNRTLALNAVMNKFPMTKVAKPGYVVKVGDDYKSVYPILTGLLATPFYLVPILINKIPNIDTHLNILKVIMLGRISASLIASVSVLLFYLILEKLNQKGKISWKLVLTAFYAFGTSTWSISSRGLWLHTTSQLIISLIILVFLAGLKKDKYIKWAGLLLGLAVLARPTNIVIAFVMSAYVFFYQREHFIKFVLLALPTIFLWFLFNYVLYGSFFVEGYAAKNDHNWTTSLTTSVPGLLFSPARSFLFISPPLILSYYGIMHTVNKKRKKDIDILMSFLGIVFILSFLLISKWWAWQGANAFGYRMLTEYLPIVGAFTYLVSIKFSKPFKVLLIVFMFYSFYIHTNAVVFRKSRCEEEHLWTTYCLKPPKRWPKY